MPQRSELVPILLLAALAFNSCGDHRPLWSLSETAVTALELAPLTTITQGRVEDFADGSCQSVVKLRVPGNSPPPTLSSDEMRSVLAQAEAIRFECIGGCGETETCKTHHIVDSADSQWATTGCVCDPQSPPSCRLTVQWAVGESSRRRIDRIACGGRADTPSCRLLFLQRGNDLQIACENQN